MAYISERFIPEDKTTELEKKQNQWRALLLSQKKAPVDLTPYQRRNQNVRQGGLEATNYETKLRNKREAAYIESLKQRLQNQVRQVGVGTGDGGSRISGPNYASSGNAPKGSFEAFLNAISGKESGGNYNARNSSSGAMGRFQIMPGNIAGSRRGWDYEALGRDVSTSEFMRNPKLQDQIARYKLSQYFNKYGARGAAIAWYAGPGALRYSSSSLGRKQGAYPSINNYANDILKRMGLG